MPTDEHFVCMKCERVLKPMEVVIKCTLPNGTVSAYYCEKCELPKGAYNIEEYIIEIDFK